MVKNPPAYLKQKIKNHHYRQNSETISLLIISRATAIEQVFSSLRRRTRVASWTEAEHLQEGDAKLSEASCWGATSVVTGESKGYIIPIIH